MRRSLIPFTFALASASVALPCASAGAQGTMPLPVGSVARVTLSRQATDARDWRRDAVRWRGTIEAAGADSFRLRLRDGRAYTFAWGELARLERYLGRDRAHGMSRGALVGGVAGTLFFGAAATMFAATDSCIDCLPASYTVPLTAVTGGVLGVVVGVVLGAAAPGEQWARVDLRSRVGLLARPGAVGVSLAIGGR
jgi:hypothetical protein